MGSNLTDYAEPVLRMMLIGRLADEKALNSRENRKVCVFSWLGYGTSRGKPNSISNFPVPGTGGTALGQWDEWDSGQISSSAKRVAEVLVVESLVVESRLVDSCLRGLDRALPVGAAGRK